MTRYIVTFCVVLVLAPGMLGQNQPTVSFQDLIVNAELNPVAYREARQLAITQGLPISIQLPTGVLMYPTGVEADKPVYAVMTNLQHPFEGGYAAFYHEIEQQFDLSSAQLRFGNTENKQVSGSKDHLRGMDLLLVPDWTADRIYAFDPVTGDLVDTAFTASNNTALESPKQALEHPLHKFITVSDQIRDLVQKFDPETGTWLSWFAPAGGVNTSILDNIRGHAYRANNNLLVCVASGANQHTIAEFDTGGNYTGNFIGQGVGGLNGPFDILIRENDILISQSSSPTGVKRYGLDGAYLSQWATITNFPQQMFQMADGRVAVANFSGTGNTGIRLYDADGNFIRLLSGVTGNRGVYQLPSGNFLTTNSAGVHEIDSTTGNLVRTVITGTNFQYINLYSPAPGGPFNPPNDLTAHAGNGIVDLAWLEPLPSGTVELSYDDGTAEGALSIGATGEGDLAVRFTPNVYPTTLLAIKVFFADVASGMSSITYTIRSGTSAGPTGVLGSGTHAINRGGFDVFNLPAGIQVTANDFFISYFEPNGQTMNLSWDTQQPSANRSWVNAPGLGLPWRTLGTVGPNFDNNLMIRAIVQEGTGPDAKVVELPPSGEGRPLTTVVTKPLSPNAIARGVSPLTGSIHLDGTGGGAINWETGSSTSASNVLSYNVYRSEDSISYAPVANVPAPTLSHSDSTVVNGTTYWYYVTAVYSGGESGPSNVVSATPVAPLVEFFDNFDSYTAGTRLVVQNPTDWQTWTGPSGTGEDPFVTNVRAYSGSNSVVVVQNNDFVKTFGSVTTGKWRMSFRMFIPPARAGYFNTMAGFRPNTNNWGMQVFFNTNGNGTIDADGQSSASFSYAQGQWLPVEVVVNLNIDSAYFYLNNVLIRQWQWTRGTFGTGSPLRLDANNFYGATANDSMYVDDYRFIQDTTTVSVGEGSHIPETFALTQNYPNPFNPSTQVRYALPKASNVTIRIYNLLGQEVAMLVNTTMEAGNHAVVWDGRNLTGNVVGTGLYFYRIEARPTDGSAVFTDVKKMLMLK
jgi:hypothetical protein